MIGRLGSPWILVGATLLVVLVGAYALLLMGGWSPLAPRDTTQAANPAGVNRDPAEVAASAATDPAQAQPSSAVTGGRSAAKKALSSSAWVNLAVRRARLSRMRLAASSTLCALRWR